MLADVCDDEKADYILLVELSETLIVSYHNISRKIELHCAYLCLNVISCL